MYCFNESWYRFLIDFDRFWASRRPPKSSKNRSKSDLGRPWLPKGCPGRAQDPPKTLPRPCWDHFGIILGPFWDHFGPFLNHFGTWLDQSARSIKTPARWRQCCPDASTCCKRGQPRAPLLGQPPIYSNHSDYDMQHGRLFKIINLVVAGSF